MDGDFDDCQRLVKAAFADPALQRGAPAHLGQFDQYRPAAPANGLSRRRRARSSMRETGVAPGLVIPTGNLGHGVAAL